MKDSGAAAASRLAVPVALIPDLCGDSIFLGLRVLPQLVGLLNSDAGGVLLNPAIVLSPN